MEQDIDLDIHFFSNINRNINTCHYYSIVLRLNCINTTGILYQRARYPLSTSTVEVYTEILIASRTMYTFLQLFNIIAISETWIN